MEINFYIYLKTPHDHNINLPKAKQRPFLNDVHVLYALILIVNGQPSWVMSYKKHNIDLMECAFVGRKRFSQESQSATR